MKDILLPGKKSFPYPMFEEYEKEVFRRILSNFDKRKVENFILQLQFVCLRALQYRKSIDQLEYCKPDMSSEKEELNGIISQLEKAFLLLQKIATGQRTPRRYHSLSDLGSIWPSKKGYYDPLEDDPIYAENYKASGHAHNAGSEIKTLIDIFKNALGNYPNGAGRPSGTVHQELAGQIAEVYKRYIGDPTSSINDPFPAILGMTFKAVGITLKYPEKLAAKILKSLTT